MSNDDKKLEQFIAKILEIQNNNTKPLKTNDLRDIALESGMTDSDWNVISETFNGHVIRGRGYIDYKNWDDAIKELEQALTLNPYHTDVLYGLALAHKNLGVQNNNAANKSASEKYAKACLNIDPNYKAAIQLISELKTAPPPQTSIPKNPPKTNIHANQNTSKTIILVVLVFVVAFIFLWFLLSRSSVDSNIPENVLPIVSENEQTMEQVSNPTNVYLVKDNQSEGINFIQEELKIDDYGTSYNVHLAAYLELKDVEIEQLKLKIDLVDESGVTLFTDIKEVVSASSAIYRSGDLITLDFSKYVQESPMPYFKEIRVSVNYIKKQAAAASYEKSPEIPVVWEMQKPTNYDIKIRERLNSVSDSYGKSVYNKIILEIENSGNTSINVLQLQIKWFNKKNEIVVTEEFYVCIDSYPNIRRGDVRIYERMFGIEIPYNQYNGYKVYVVNVN